MRLSPFSLALACAVLAAGAATAEPVPDGPVATSGGGAGAAPTADDVPAVAVTPSAPRRGPPPLASDLSAAADAGRRAPLLGEYHGSVGAVVGTGGLRGAYGHINAHPNDHTTIDLRFSTLHSRGYPYGGPYGQGVYGPGVYGPGVYGPGVYGPGLYGPSPFGAAAPYPPVESGWTTEELGPGLDPAPVVADPAGPH